MVAVIIFSLVFGGSLVSDPEAQLADWYVEVIETGITVEQMEEWREIYSRLPRWIPPPPAQVTLSPQGGVERWRPLVEQHFEPADVPWAMRVMACESNGDPYAKNRTSTASGLFQFLRGWWSGAWGYPAFDPFDPEENVQVAAWLYYEDGPSHWVCK